MIALLPPIVPSSRRGSDLVLRVEDAATRSDRGQFISFPRHLYRGDRRWIPPIGAARKDALRHGRNPLLTDGRLGAFFCVAQNLGFGDETVGLLAAWPAAGARDDEIGAWGSWGLFDSVNVQEVMDGLFYKAETWLFEHTQGISGIRGPCGLEPLVAPGLLTDGFDAEPLAFVPYNLPYYPEMVEGLGYERGARWRAYALDLARQAGRERREVTVSAESWSRISRAYAARDDGFMERERLIPGLVQWLEHLAGRKPFGFNAAWQRAAGRAFGRVIAVTHEENAEGPAACFGIPDIGHALRVSGGLRSPLGWLLYDLGLRRATRLHVFAAVAPAIWTPDRLAYLYVTVAERAAAAGYRRMEIAPVSDEDERSAEALTAIGARPVQQFTIYEKPL